MSKEKQEPNPGVNDTLSEKEIQEREALIQMMQEEVIIKGNPPKDKAFILDLLTSKIPLLAGFLDGGGKIADLSTRIAQLHHSSQALQGASTGLDFVGLGFSIINFFRFPAIYLAAYIVGEKPPVTLSNNARWLYSTVILGLSVTAMFVPAAAPPITLILASLGLAVSLGTMVNLIYQRRKVRKGLKETNSDIEVTINELAALQEQAKQLGSKFGSLNKNDEHYQQNATKLCKEIDELNGHYLKTRGKLQTLYDQKLAQETKLGMMGGMAFMDKGVSIAISSLAIIGIVLTLFFPQVGLAILAATATLAVTYMVARIAGPYIISGLKTMGTWLAGQFKSVTDPSDSPELANTLDKQSKDRAEQRAENESPKARNAQEIEPVLKDSTQKTMEGLNSLEHIENSPKYIETVQRETKAESSLTIKSSNSGDEDEVEVVEDGSPGIPTK